MRIVLLGGDGQIGWELRSSLAPLGDVVVLGREAPGSASGTGYGAATGSVRAEPRRDVCGDLESPDELRRTLRELRPDVIVNAAAYTDVDRAEAEPERARRINAEGPRALAAEAKRLDTWLVHYSTDYVFDGSGSTPWQEDDRAAPLSVYGRTKWEGEQAVRDAGCRHVIFRTQWIYSTRRRNFVRTILRLAAERETLDVTDAEIGAPTGADLVADVTAHVVRSLTPASASNTYHVAARGEISRHGYACFVVEAARRAGWPLRLTASAISPAKPADASVVAVRPRNSRLGIERLERTFGLRMPDWKPGVARVIERMSEQRLIGNEQGLGEPLRRVSGERIL